MSNEETHCFFRFDLMVSNHRNERRVIQRAPRRSPSRIPPRDHWSRVAEIGLLGTNFLNTHIVGIGFPNLDDLLNYLKKSIRIVVLWCL